MKKERLFDKIDKARRTLDLPEVATINMIKDKYRELSRRWHPDQCRGDENEEKKSHEMQQQINEAYSILMSYCNSYEYSFTREDIERFPSGDEFWWDRFNPFDS